MSASVFSRPLSTRTLFSFPIPKIQRSVRGKSDIIAFEEQNRHVVTITHPYYESVDQGYGDSAQQYDNSKNQRYDHNSLNYSKKPSLKPNLSITPLELLALPVLQYGGRIVFVNSKDDEKQYLPQIQELFKCRILGLDTEARPALFGKKNKTAIIQVSGRMESNNSTTTSPLNSSNSSNSLTVIWRVHSEKSLPSGLKKILRDPNILKVAQGARSEIKTLIHDFEFDSNSNFSNNFSNFLDLFELATSINTNPRSLQGLVGIFLRRRLKKDLRCSHWDRDKLSTNQIEYAALDAYATLAVFEEIRRTYSGNPLVKIENHERRIDERDVEYGFSSGGSRVMDNEFSSPEYGMRKHENDTNNGFENGMATSDNITTRSDKASVLSTVEPTVEAKVESGSGKTQLQSEPDQSHAQPPGDPLKSKPRLAGDPLQILMQTCVKRGYLLKSEGFDSPADANGKFIAKFRLSKMGPASVGYSSKFYAGNEDESILAESVHQSDMLYHSSTPSTTIRNAQRECARKILKERFGIEVEA